MSKVTVVAHPIQGLVKYHGLEDPSRRVPFHDSISVCVEELWTKTTVETTNDSEDKVVINNRIAKAQEKNRVHVVLDKLRELAGTDCKFHVSSINSLVGAKGLGFSSSGFSALGVAASKALRLNLDLASLSEIVRLGSGSATRSLAGGFAIWYANKMNRSYAEMIAGPEDVDMKMIIIPIPHEISTEDIHRDIVTSPFFFARLKTVTKTLPLMRKAILDNRVREIGEIAEKDSLSLHATTMTGNLGIILMKPQTILVIDEIRKLRRRGIPAWFSLDTGPSVFINVHSENAVKISEHLEKELGLRTISSNAGGPPQVSQNHLF